MREDMAGNGTFTTLPLSRHATTNIEVIQKFLAVSFQTEQITHRAVKVRVQT